VTQAQTMLTDASLRQRIIANAKTYVEKSFSENAEYEAYSKMTKEMYATQNEKDSKNADDQSDQKAIRTATKKVTLSENVESLTAEKADTTETASGGEEDSDDQNQEENKTPETSQISSKPNSTSEKGKKQPSKTKGGKSRAKQKNNGVKRPSEKPATSSTPSPRGPKVAATFKTDTRKRSTNLASEKNSPSVGATSTKGGGTTPTMKNGQPAAPMVSDNDKTTGKADPVLKRTPSVDSVNESSTLKPPSAQCLTARRASVATVGSVLAPSRLLQTTKK